MSLLEIKCIWQDIADDSGTEVSGTNSPEDVRPTAAEVEKSGGRQSGVDSGTSLSSKEVTPRDGVIDEQDDKEKIPDIKKAIEERLDIDLEDPDVVKATTKIQAGFRGAMTRKSMKQDKKEKDMEEGEDEETGAEAEEGEEEEGESESEYEDSEEEGEEVGKGKNTFVLLKQLVGIMKLGAGPKMAATVQKEAASVNKENGDKLENGNGTHEVINGDASVPKAEEEKGDEVNGDVHLVGNGNPE